MAGKQRIPEAIMICLAYQGHINPFVNLALKLASKGFTITFVHLEFMHHKLAKAHYSNTHEVDFFSEARKSGLDIRYTTISDGFPLEFDRDLSEEYWEFMLRDFPGRVDEFVGEMIKSDGRDVRLLVADTIFVWPAAISEKYNLVYVSLWTQPALVFSLDYHWDILEEKGHFPCRDNLDENINYVPGVESISTRDMMSYLKESESSGIVAKVSRLAFEKVKKADFILHNTVQELEPETISALSKYQPSYAVGPLNFYKNIQANTVTARSLWLQSDCTRWLESKSPGSVLYISFGSLVHVSKEVIEELAYGLVLSEVNFLWVVREGIMSNGDTNVFPAGFEDEMKDKGSIVKWCNQIEVLSNPAVGGFLTHNGWNSTVESMWCGVPMICYPFAYDQPTNRKLVVDDWKIGINLCDDVSFDRKEIAEKIKNFMSGSKLKQEVNKVKTIMQNALKNDGSSERNFDLFIEDLEAKIRDKIKTVNESRLASTDNMPEF